MVIIIKNFRDLSVGLRQISKILDNNEGSNTI